MQHDGWRSRKLHLTLLGLGLITAMTGVVVWLLYAGSQAALLPTVLTTYVGAVFVLAAGYGSGNVVEKAAAAKWLGQMPEAPAPKTTKPPVTAPKPPAD